MKSLCHLVILLLGFTALFAGDVVSLSEARTLAKRANKPILIDFWADN